MESLCYQELTVPPRLNTINKFTVQSAKCLSPPSPDSPPVEVSHNGLVQPDEGVQVVLPIFNFTDFGDQFLEEMGLIDRSPGKKFSTDEMEKVVTTLVVRHLLNSSHLKQRLDNEYEKYKSEYDCLLSLVWDISNRLRDHRCIGTSEPIKPVFVLLEEIKLRLRDLLQTTGQVAILVHESRMRRCWNLVTNYLATLRQENEELRNNALNHENISTQTGFFRHRLTMLRDSSHKLHHFKLGFRNNCKMKILIGISVCVIAIVSSLNVVLHLNCRLTSSETQYCPLDGIVRSAIGIPPM
ncbi:uncharacterized protein LOC132703752 isoform X2 [Cylas formicarius]|uniref:uncharacterized protein LOC132703752 isoform X2 n=1 Tax=Cylas formicarius TaxID=197179 RepID=UPI00295879CA|nr:uncharacterized protein LOC132703752 isoform X2 [Cylas formicarius]